MENIKERGLTPQEAADLIGCSAYTIKSLARERRIPFYKIGVRYRFTRETLLDWIEEQEINYKQEEIV